MNRLKVHGVDLSHHNADPDFAEAKAAGLKWVIHKAVEGSTLTDSQYASRRKAARKAGLQWGAYGFARPDAGGKDARIEANHLIKVARPRAGDLVPALDYEVSFPGAEKWCKQYQNEIKRLLKARGLEVERQLHYGPDDFGADYKPARWVPRYNKSNTPPTVPWDIFQFSDGDSRNSCQVGYPGLGNVDLNHVSSDFDMKSLTLSKIKEPAPAVESLLIGHISMQFSDTPEQMRADAEAIFSRAKKKHVAWITGTEAGRGADPLRSLLKEAADQNGYRFWMGSGSDTWFAVSRDLIDSGWEAYKGPPVIPGKAGQYTTKRVTSVSFTNDKLGRITVIAGHYLTKGKPSKDPELSQNLEENRRLAIAIGEHAKLMGAGTGLVWYGGDQNISDRLEDTFFEQPLTTAGDELGVWPGTGHGPIDVIASYDPDVRVTAESFDALRDREFFLHSDHFWIEAQYSVRLLAPA